MAELEDARDLKSLGPRDCTSSILVPGTIKQALSGLPLGAFSFLTKDIVQVPSSPKNPSHPSLGGFSPYGHLHFLFYFKKQRVSRASYKMNVVARFLADGVDDSFCKRLGCHFIQSASS